MFTYGSHKFYFFFFLAFCTVHNDTSLYQEIDLSSHTVIPRVKRMARKKENIKLVAKERPHCFKLIGQEQHKYNTTPITTLYNQGMEKRWHGWN